MLRKPKLSPHYHSGKYLEHKHTSYGSLIIALFLSGMCLVGITSSTLADTVSVQAVVPGTAPGNAPTISTPLSGQHFTSIPIAVRGSCDAGLLVNLYRNNILSGAAICGPSGSYLINSDLFIGQNNLVAQMLNAGDQPSPYSSGLVVYYDLPSSPVNLVNGSVSGTNGNVILTAQSVYKGTTPGQSLSWPIEIIGGVAPYAVSVDWGDGSTDLISRSQPGNFSVTHTYAQAGGYKGGYTMSLKAVDAQGTIGTLQLVAIVNNAVGLPIVGSIKPTSSNPLTDLVIAWPLWIVAFLLVVSFWVGDIRGRRRDANSQSSPPSPNQIPGAIGA
ncbi:MAG: hypothetical protein ACHQUB_03540 [Candidatus Saccharimonadia bacterium]